MQTSARKLPHLTFDFDEVAALANHGRTAPQRIAGADPEADVVLVGDHGVYFMSAGNPGLRRPDGTGSKVAYATECNPDANFDEWWETKQATWGGDDGAEYFSLSPFIEQARQGSSPPRTIVVGFDGESIVIEIEAEAS